MKETGFNIEFIGELGNVMMPALQGNKYWNTYKARKYERDWEKTKQNSIIE